MVRIMGTGIDLMATAHATPATTRHDAIYEKLLVATESRQTLFQKRGLVKPMALVNAEFGEKICAGAPARHPSFKGDARKSDVVIPAWCGGDVALRGDHGHECRT